MQGDRTLGNYVTDRGFPANLEPLMFGRALRGVDALYHEATFGEELSARAVEACHSTARQAALLARLAGVKRLVIGYYSSRYQDERCLLDEARREFPNTELAAEGRCFTV